MLDWPCPYLIGVVHLPPLPGSPRHVLSMRDIVDVASRDAESLGAAGFDGLIVENYGDLPFHRDRVEPATVAAMSVVVARIKESVDIRLGVNVLRNDAVGALSVAKAGGADFIRVNVHTGVMSTDQGIITGHAAKTLRQRARFADGVAILADVHVKHAAPLTMTDIGDAARETAYRGLADGLIVTGPATGDPPNIDELARVKSCVPDRPLFVGSGASVQNVGEFLQHADGCVVGTSLKADGRTENPIDIKRAEAFVRAARG